jgi:hypothetical protein
MDYFCVILRLYKNLDTARQAKSQYTVEYSMHTAAQKRYNKATQGNIQQQQLEILKTTQGS